MKKIIILITILTLSSIALADIPADCPDGMVSYWKLNESSGDAIDYIGSNDGTVSGASQGVAGQVDTAYDLDGIDDYVGIDDDDSLSFGDSLSDSPFSISAWINMDDAYKFRIFSKGDLEYLFSTSTTGKLGLTLYDGTTTGEGRMGFQSDLDVSTAIDGWLHVVGTYDGNGSPDGIKVYLNGTVLNGTTFSAGGYVAMHNTARGAAIGSLEEVPDYGNGAIDEIAVYNRSLSASEVLLHYNNGLDGNDYCYSESGGAGGYEIPEFSSIGLILIAAMFVLLMVYRTKK